MAGGGLWRKTLVYFGLADEDEDYYDDLPSVVDRDEPSYRDSYDDRDRGRERDRERERDKIRRMPDRDSRSRRSPSDFDDIFSEDSYRDDRGASFAQQRGAQLRSVPGGLDQPQVRVQLVLPKSFNDAQIIADKYKGDIPVILNLQQSETELAKRLIDFASGLTYALDGGMQRVADKVFLLTPRNVEVSAEERQRILDRGFFNQY